MRSVWAVSPDAAARARMRTPRIVSVLERNFGPELELAGRQLAVHLSIVCGIDDTTELGEVGRIEQVKRFGADFNANAFADAEAFAECGVDIENAWAGHRVATEHA